MTWVAIARVDEIEDPGAKGFRAGPDDAPLFGFVVRQGSAVYGYVNVCPHMGRPLEWKPDAFLTRDKSMIMCSAHGALFEKTTGLCVAGPCPGRRLTKLETRITGGRVEIDCR